jgi:hypothetical protein
MKCLRIYIPCMSYKIPFISDHTSYTDCDEFTVDSEIPYILRWYVSAFLFYFILFYFMNALLSPKLRVKV